MRLVNRVLAAVFAVALAVVGVLVVVEVVAQRLGNRPAFVHWPRIYAWAHRTSFTQGSVRAACVLVALLGLALLLAELKPPRPQRFTVDSDLSDSAYTRRGVATAIGHAVGDVDGISRTKVTVRRRRIRVDARTGGLAPYTAETLQEPAASAAATRLDELDLRPTPALRVRVHTRKS